MSKNQIQYQKGYSLLELFKDYGTENVLKRYLTGNGLRASVALNAVLQVTVH
jgi:hypothetical protein